ncbi:hypothetical protein GDO86_001009 [Hymenochirus boettgeri]|uniref:THAP-type domain-containing protein n=1 Tax=Hymenochirus boettgeri TaxID=247094 RepID=A0A8T2KE62_9PIPI|nr:hypothetical protein GDO86_001009 [Hymenochirus boettgeri]KAG8454624.1 hypothetical protein GDO86_001009 [Hymenochirus boettgeri]KAG8454625.1 hypothetical protein GDO86_001009 [Hymenochirus boettgeri]
MPMTCVAYGCYNRFFKGCKKQFFRFPMKDRKRLFDWIAAVRRKNWMPSGASRICSDHFTENDYMLRPGAQIPRLRLDAVPSVFDGFPEDLKERLRREKEEKNRKRKILEIPSELKTDHTGGTAPSSTIQDFSSFQRMMVSTEGKSPCVANHCSNLYFDGCEKLFFRMPMEDPDLTAKWVLAIGRKYWKPTASCRICIDHFAEKDLIYSAETVPKLRKSAVPSVFHLKRAKRRKKYIKKHMAKGKAGNDGQKENCITEDHKYSSAQTKTGTMNPSLNPEVMILRRTVKTLQRQIQRQRQRISSLCTLIKELRKKNKEKNELCQVTIQILG